MDYGDHASFIDEWRKSIEESTKTDAEKEKMLHDLERFVRATHCEPMPAPDAITIEWLNAASPEYVWTLSDYIHHWCYVHNKGRSDEAFEELPLGLRMIEWINRIEAEVPNGGFEQFFWNSAAREIDGALEALRTIGATQRVCVLEKAIAAYEQAFGRPLKLTDRWQAITEQSVPPFSTFSQEYWSVQNRDEKIVPLVDVYLRSHLQEFVHP